MRYSIRTTMSETDDGKPVRRWTVETGGGYSPGAFDTHSSALRWVESDCDYRLGRPPKPAAPVQPPAVVVYVATREDVEAPSTLLGVAASPEGAQRLAQAHWQAEHDADRQRAPGPVPLLEWFDDSDGRTFPTWAAEAGRWGSYSIERIEVRP